jgi:hypothetical protein
LLAGQVHAQWNGNQQGGYGQSGYGGYGGGGYGGQGGGFGGGGFGNSGFGNSGFGNSGFGNSGFGAGGFGSSGIGNSGFGNSGFGSGLGGFGNQQGGFGQGNAGGFGQRGVGPGGRNFVGRDAAEVQNNFQQQVGGQQGLQGFNDIVQNLNDLRNQRRRGREQQEAPPPVKVQLRPAFDLPLASTAEVQAGAQAQINRTLQVRGSSPVSLAMAEGRTVLTGVVASEHDRALIAQLAALEPGVGTIENRLTVATPEPPLQPPTAPADSSQEVASPANNPQ